MSLYALFLRALHTLHRKSQVELVNVFKIKH